MATEKTRLKGERPTASKDYKDDHYTPSWVYSPLGPFDLDPCAGPNTIAAVNYNYAAGQDGLLLHWEGIAWVNPPYSLKKAFLDKCALHGNGFALLPNATETIWWQDAADQCCAYLLVKGRIQFSDWQGKPQKGNTKGSTIFAYGPEAVKRLEKAVLKGKLKGKLHVN
jgi:hypothetical protein